MGSQHRALKTWNMRPPDFPPPRAPSRLAARPLPFPPLPIPPPRPGHGHWALRPRVIPTLDLPPPPWNCIPKLDSHGAPGFLGVTPRHERFRLDFPPPRRSWRPPVEAPAACFTVYSSGIRTDAPVLQFGTGVLLPSGSSTSTSRGSRQLKESRFAEGALIRSGRQNPKAKNRYSMTGFNS